MSVNRMLQLVKIFSRHKATLFESSNLEHCVGCYWIAKGKMQNLQEKHFMKLMRKYVMCC